jgi:glutathione S-transferase
MALVLHGFRYSVYVRVARIVLAEKGLAYENVEVDPFAPEMRIEYLDLHPFRRVPTLVDGEFVLYETEAITRYIGEAFPGRGCSQRNHVTVPGWRKSSRPVDSYAYAEDRARKVNLRELRLLTNQAFQANIRLYESVGFHIDRTEPFAGGGTTVHMSKAIAPNAIC